jgi:hypothetical protein
MVQLRLKYLNGSVYGNLRPPFSDILRTVAAYLELKFEMIINDRNCNLTFAIHPD